VTRKVSRKREGRPKAVLHSGLIAPIQFISPISLCRCVLLVSFIPDLPRHAVDANEQKVEEARFSLLHKVL